MSTKKMYGIESLEAEFGPMTVGLYLKFRRESQEVTQQAMADKLGISKAHLCDIERGRRFISPERAAKFAKTIRAPETTLIKLALQDLLRAAKLPYEIEIKRVG